MFLNHLFDKGQHVCLDQKRMKKGPAQGKQREKCWPEMAESPSQDPHSTTTVAPEDILLAVCPPTAGSPGPLQLASSPCFWLLVFPAGTGLGFMFPFVNQASADTSAAGEADVQNGSTWADAAVSLRGIPRPSERFLRLPKALQQHEFISEFDPLPCYTGVQGLLGPC